MAVAVEEQQVLHDGASTMPSLIVYHSHVLGASPHYGLEVIAQNVSGAFALYHGLTNMILSNTNCLSAWSYLQRVNDSECF
ncbi:MAG: hypothetical protein U9Q82_12430, partial [Chloroflexota bacterium]|nr:hypothetical protein [Chloroflexota bacterium]